LAITVVTTLVLCGLAYVALLVVVTVLMSNYGSNK
jgi:hypothetical protein